MLVDVTPSPYDLIIFDLAAQLITEKKVEAPFVAAAHALERRQEGDALGERFWADVLRAIEAMSDDMPITIQ